jgi:hypothetical protein
VVSNVNTGEPPFPFAAGNPGWLLLAPSAVARYTFTTLSVPGSPPTSSRGGTASGSPARSPGHRVRFIVPVRHVPGAPRVLFDAPSCERRAGKEGDGRAGDARQRVPVAGRCCSGIVDLPAGRRETRRMTG